MITILPAAGPILGFDPRDLARIPERCDGLWVDADDAYPPGDDVARAPMQHLSLDVQGVLDKTPSILEGYLGLKGGTLAQPSRVKLYRYAATTPSPPRLATPDAAGFTVVVLLNDHPHATVQLASDEFTGDLMWYIGAGCVVRSETGRMCVTHWKGRPVYLLSAFYGFLPF